MKAEYVGKLHLNTDTKVFRVCQSLRTFCLFLTTRIIVLPNNLRTSLEILKKILLKFDVWNLVDGTLYTLGLDRPNFTLAVISLLTLGVVSFIEERGPVREKIAHQNVFVRWFIYYALFFSIVIFGIYGPGYDAKAFIYMQY